MGWVSVFKSLGLVPKKNKDVFSRLPYIEMPYLETSSHYQSTKPLQSVTKLIIALWTLHYIVLYLNSLVKNYLI